MKRHLPILAAVAMLAASGCTVAPTALTLAASGVTYATTGKGPADHVISGLADQDCALHRGLGDTPVCRAHAEPVEVADTAAPQAESAPATAPAPKYIPLADSRPKNWPKPGDLWIIPTPGGVRAVMNMRLREYKAGNGS